MVTLEMTVVNTALVPVSDELQDFRRAPWIINAYLLTWSGECLPVWDSSDVGIDFVLGSLILWAQFSHTIGRKSSLLTAAGLFMVFSLACAVAQTSVQL